MAVNYGLNQVRFPAPVPVGSRVRLIARRRLRRGRGADGVQLAVDLTVEMRGSDKPAAVAEALYRYHA